MVGMDVLTIVASIAKRKITVITPLTASAGLEHKDLSLSEIITMDVADARLCRDEAASGHLNGDGEKSQVTA
jgi:hypothetical protein